MTHPRRAARRPDLVTLTIDGVQVSVPKDTLVIRAAEQVGIQIPRFCDHPLLAPVGACRQCLVEVPDAGNGRGFPKPQASCTLPVAEGMVVSTQVTSEVADKAQQGIMEFLLINHPLDCPVCDKGGECPLQNQAMSNGRGESRFEGVKRTFPKPINISAQVLLDRERCVLCARCTRFSEQIAGDPFIALIERGALQQVGIYEKEPFESYFSGNTIQICPVGALTSADYRFRSRPVRPGLEPVGRRARRLRLRDPRRPPPRQGDAPPRGQRPRGQRGVDHRQGPVRVPLRPVRRPDHLPAWSATTTASSAPRRGPRRSPSPPAACAGRRRRRCCPVAGSPPRTPTPTPSSPGSRSAPTTSTSGPGRSRPRRPTSWPPRSRCSSLGLLRRPRAGADRRPRGPRARGRGRHDLPAAAQGLARPAAHPRRRARAVHLPRPAQDGRPRWCRPRPGDEAAALRRAARARRVRRRQARRDPGRRAARHRPGRAVARPSTWPRKTGARLAWVPRRAGDRGAVEAGCLPSLLPGGRPRRRRRRPRRRRHRLGRRLAARGRRPRRRRHRRAPSAPASSAAWSSAASTPTTPPTRRHPRGRSTPRGSWSPSSCARPR